MARAAETAPQIAIRTRRDLRDWLSANHETARTVWLVTFKRPHPDYLAYEMIVEELLCWGWIDSLPRALDSERSMLMAAPRNPKSAWSAINKAHVERAVASGAMTAAGLAKVEIARANGMWSFLDDVERLEVPGDLAEALGAVDGRQVWDSYPRSVRRGTLEWIKMARTEPTRAARIADVAASAAEGQRPGLFRR